MFDPKHPDSEESFAFDFTNLLAAGETIDSALISVSVVNGTDPSPGSMVGGSPTIVTPKVNIKLVGGIDGVIYCVKCVATTNALQDLVLESDLKVTKQC